MTTQVRTVNDQNSGIYYLVKAVRRMICHRIKAGSTTATGVDISIFYTRMNADGVLYLYCQLCLHVGFCDSLCLSEATTGCFYLFVSFSVSVYSARLVCLCELSHDHLSHFNTGP